jgi:Oxidoreductase family, NAD-binding Rossmann fold
VKIGLLGTGFGSAHAAIYDRHPQVDSVVVFGRTPAKLETFATEYGFATTTDLDSVFDDRDVDLIDICLPTALHAGAPPARRCGLRRPPASGGAHPSRMDTQRWGISVSRSGEFRVSVVRRWRHEVPARLRRWSSMPGTSEARRSSDTLSRWG